MKEDQIVKMLEKFSDVLHVSNPFIEGFRWVGWMIIKGLATCLDATLGGQKQMLKLVNFYNSQPVKDFLSKYTVLFVGIGTIAIMLLCLKIARANNATRKVGLSTYFENFLFAVCIVAGLPSILALMVGIFTPAANATLATDGSSLSIFQNNITDVYNVDKKGWKSTEVTNNLQKKDDLKYIDINEQVDTGGTFFDTSPLSNDGKDILSKRLTEISGKKTLAKLKSHWLTEDDAYYRYSFHPFYMIIELLIRTAVGIFVLFMIALMAFNLAIIAGIFKISALSDLESGKRNRDLFVKCRNLLIVLYVTICMQSVFSLFCTYIKTIDLNPFLTLIAMAAAAAVVIGGPSVVEQTFGFDAGLNKGFGSMLMGIGQFTRGTSGAVAAGGSVLKGTANAAKNTAKGASYTGSAGAGIISGLLPKNSFNQPNGQKPEQKRTGADSAGVKQAPTTSQKDSSSGETGRSESLIPLGNEGKGTSEEKGNDIESKRPSETTKPLLKSNQTSGENTSGSKVSPNVNPKTEQLKGTESNQPTPLGSVEGTKGNLDSSDSQDSQEQLSPETKREPYTPSPTDTLGTVVKGNLRNKGTQIVNAPFIQKNRRVYDVSKNTTVQIKNKMKGSGKDEGS